MEQFKDIMRLVRWSNLLFLAALVWLMEKWVATPVLNAAAFGEQMPWYILLLLIAATTLIAGGGYVINDYFDVKIDRINRPDEVVVTRSISKPAAMRLSMSLSGVGIACGLIVALWLRSLPIGILFILIPGLLWFYSSSYKRLFMIGNLIIALLAAVTPLLVAMVNVALLQLRYAEILPYTTLVHDLYAWLGGFALFAFLLTWIREIIKDMQDQMGDRELECHSMPVVWGERWTRYHRPSMVSYPALPYGMDEPQHALYRPGYRNADVVRTLAVMVRQDTVRLQNMPAVREVHDAAGHALQYLYRQRLLISDLGLLLQRYHLRFLVIHTRHGTSHAGIDIRRITYDVFLILVGQVVPAFLMIEGNGGSQVTGVVQQYHVQPYQVAHESREED